MMFSILELVTCFKAGGPRLGLTMSQGATRKKSLGTTDLRDEFKTRSVIPVGMHKIPTISILLIPALSILFRYF